MSLNYPLTAATKADMKAVVLPDGWVYELLGDTAQGDQPPIEYIYSISSTATDDNVNVITPTAQIGSAGRYLIQKRSYNDLSNKPAIADPQQSYQGTTKRQNSFPVFLSSTVGSGVAVFQLTTDGTAGGTSLFPNAVITDSLNLYVNDATASYQMSAAFTNSNKTLTVTANKLTTANILSGILGQAAANTSVVRLQIWGY